MNKKTLVIGDTQFTKHSPMRIVKATAKWIVKHRPDEIVIIGDWFDLESLSFYASEAEQEGRRLRYDIHAGVEALDHLLSPLFALQEKQKLNKKRVYKPKIVFTMGNHEERLKTYLKKNPRLEGILPDLTEVISRYGIEVYQFLVPYVGLNNVHYFHYLANPMTGKPVGGTMDNKLNKVTFSFVMGHQQHYQYAERQQPRGNPQFGIVVGAFYEQDEAYKGAQGNTHTRGTAVLFHHDKGTDVEFLSCNRLLSMFKP